MLLLGLLLTHSEERVGITEHRLERPPIIKRDPKLAFARLVGMAHCLNRRRNCVDRAEERAINGVHIPAVHFDTE